EAHGLTMAHGETHGGSSFWMRTPTGEDARLLAERLRPLGVLIEPGHVFFDSENAPLDFYRLAYSSIDASKIEEGIRLIASRV
ncbi:MAG TPA: GntR family transcriptional regulator, partial [Rhizobiaceae bacterium]|nr:GntR family transcriptional regulator [Rhizobiaceae bacterium]